MLAMPTAHNSWGAVSVNGKPEPCANMMRPRRKSHVSKGERSALAFRTKQGHIANEEPRTSVKPSKVAGGIANARIFIRATCRICSLRSRPKKQQAFVYQKFAQMPTLIVRSVPYPFAHYERSPCHDPSPTQEGNFRRDGI